MSLLVPAENQGVEEQGSSQESTSNCDFRQENGTSSFSPTKETGDSNVMYSPPPTQETGNGLATSPSHKTKNPVICNPTLNKEISNSSVIDTQPSRYKTQEFNDMFSSRLALETGDSRDAKEKRAISNVEPAQLPAKERARLNGSCCPYPGKAVNCSSEQKERSLNSSTIVGMCARLFYVNWSKISM